MKKMIEKMTDLLNYCFPFFAYSIMISMSLAVGIMVYANVAAPRTEVVDEADCVKVITYETKAERDEIIKSVIEWETNYDEEVEAEILKNMNMVPDAILDRWLSLDSHIIVCPPVVGYLEENHIENANKDDEGYATAFNRVTRTGDMVTGSKIYVLGTSYYVALSLLHEMGHYVYYEQFGFKTEYTLPNLETHGKAFVDAEKQGYEYYLSTKEYFAEMFDYTVLNGVSTEYPDTSVMQYIIDNFQY